MVWGGGRGSAGSTGSLAGNNRPWEAHAYEEGTAWALWYTGSSQHWWSEYCTGPSFYPVARSTRRDVGTPAIPRPVAKQRL